MWIFGLLIGLLVGELVDHGEGAVFGAALGAIAGMLLSVMKRLNTMTDLQAQIHSLEARLTAMQQRSGKESTANVATAAATPASADTESLEPGAVDTGSIETGSIKTGSIQTHPIETLPEQSAAPARVSVDASASAASSATQSAASGVRTSSTMPAREQPQADDTTPPSSGVDDITRLWKWLSGGNALVRVGVVVLFFGVAFLLKYAYEHTHIPIELRLTAVAIGAIVMLVIGWRLRTRNPVYALAVQGGGTGVLYLVIFGAFRLFKLLPGEAAFILLIAIAALSAILAIVQNAQSLAVLAVSGGFLAPILASTGSGSHVMLFSYYAVLNLGILAVALYKAWRPLNVLGFVFTFSIGSMWGARFYRDDLFSSTEPFLVFFTLLYIVIAVIFAFRQAPRLKHYVDSTLILPPKSLIRLQQMDNPRPVPFPTGLVV